MAAQCVLGGEDGVGGEEEGVGGREPDEAALAWGPSVSPSSGKAVPGPSSTVCSIIQSPGAFCPTQLQQLPAPLPHIALHLSLSSTPDTHTTFLYGAIWLTEASRFSGTSAYALLLSLKGRDARRQCVFVRVLVIIAEGACWQGVKGRCGTWCRRAEVRLKQQLKRRGRAVVYTQHFKVYWCTT